MRFLLPQVTALDERYDGRRPLPQRLERLAALLAAGDLTQPDIARRCRTSVASITRLKRQPAFRARLAVLVDEFAKRAQEDEPLAHAGRRVALVGEEVRALRDQLHANGYTTVLGVSKQGNPIVGFDSARVSAMLRGVALLDQMTAPRQSTIADPLSQTVGVQATVTLDQAVVKVQALLSRVADAGDGQPPAGQAPGHPTGVGGGMSAAGTDTIESGGSPIGPQQILDAKGEVVGEDEGQSGG